MQPKRVVMLVEDSDDDILIVQRAFRVLKLPHDLIVCRSAEEAFQRLGDLRHPPDIMLLDLNLPRVSGLEFLRRLKTDPTLRTMPVVILSASDREVDIAGAYAAGANHYLVKPIKFESFVELLRHWNDYWNQTGRLPPRH